jgi:hypothetical protein
MLVEAGIDDVSRFGVTSVTAGLAEPLEIFNDRSPFLVEFSLGHPAILLRSMVEVDVEQLFVVAASVGDAFDEIFLARKCGRSKPWRIHTSSFLLIPAWPLKR